LTGIVNDVNQALIRRRDYQPTQGRNPNQERKSIGDNLTVQTRTLFLEFGAPVGGTVDPGNISEQASLPYSSLHNSLPCRVHAAGIL
jgi:hypothetical protein